MDISTYPDITLAWLAGQLAWLSELPPAYIAVAAVVPVLLARNLLAQLWTALLALAALSLCALQAAPWDVLATAAAAAGFLAAFSAIVRGRRERALRGELAELKVRLNQLEADDARKFMVALRNPVPPPGSGDAVADEPPY